MEKILLYSRDEEQVSTVSEAAKEVKALPEVLVFDGALDFLYAASTFRSGCIALMDVDDPECQDLKAVKLLKKLNPDIALVFLSKSGKYAVEAFEEGVSDYVRAPFSSEKVTLAIEKAERDIRRNAEQLPYIRTFSSFEVMVAGRPIP